MLLLNITSLMVVIVSGNTSVSRSFMGFSLNFCEMSEIFINTSFKSSYFWLRCNEWCRLLVITPCRHILCLDCVAMDSEKCSLPGCGFLYEMQSPEILTRPENPNPKWPVPKDLIELQPSYRQVRNLQS